MLATRSQTFVRTSLTTLFALAVRRLGRVCRSFVLLNLICQISGIDDRGWRAICRPAARVRQARIDFAAPPCDRQQVLPHRKYPCTDWVHRRHRHASHNALGHDRQSLCTHIFRPSSNTLHRRICAFNCGTRACDRRKNIGDRPLFTHLVEQLRSNTRCPQPPARPNSPQWNWSNPAADVSTLFMFNLFLIDDNHGRRRNCLGL